MELEYLKEVWKVAADIEAFPAGEKKALLNVGAGAPSQSVVSKMKRNLLYELLTVLVCVTIIAVFYFIAFGGRLKEVSWAYMLLALIFISYYYKKNKLLKSMQCPACRVKYNLSLQLTTLEKYVRLYLIVGTFMAPAVMLFFYALLHYKRISVFYSSYEIRNAAGFTLLYLLVTAIFTIIFYFFNRWYINRLYGRYIQKLKDLLLEMEE